jgi:hypothetical protein
VTMLNKFALEAEGCSVLKFCVWNFLILSPSSNCADVVAYYQDFEDLNYYVQCAQFSFSMQALRAVEIYGYAFPIS